MCSISVRALVGDAAAEMEHFCLWSTILRTEIVQREVGSDDAQKMLNKCCTALNEYNSLNVNEYNSLNVNKYNS